MKPLVVYTLLFIIFTSSCAEKVVQTTSANENGQMLNREIEESVKKGDFYFYEKQEFVKAKEHYEYALSLRPADAEIKSKLDECNQAIDLQSRDCKYDCQKLISKADEYYE